MHPCHVTGDPVLYLGANKQMREGGSMAQVRSLVNRFVSPFLFGSVGSSAGFRPSTALP